MSNDIESTPPELQGDLAALLSIGTRRSNRRALHSALVSDRQAPVIETAAPTPSMAARSIAVPQP